jgi:hypothetical protein
MAMVGLLVFAGLAVDAGVIYSGSVNLSKAVDAAALAGVVELPHETATANADMVANDFLAANSVVVEEFASHRSSGPMGSHIYAITVTHQVDLYFLPLVGLESVRMPDSAIAEYDPQIGIYASHRGPYGEEQTVNLAVFGPDSCIRFGDAYSPSDSPWWSELEGIYHFRLDIPADYEERALELTEKVNSSDTNSVLRIEIWDPDCYNAPGDTVEAVHPYTHEPMTLVCEAGDVQRHQPCTPRIVDNSFAFLRIDENRRGRSSGGCASNISYTPAWNTTTQYGLYYYRRDAGGGLEKRALARYTKGGADGDHDTDLRWVCPGGSLPGDPIPDVGTFELDALPEDIYVAPDGTRTLFLEVQALSGASENGFDLWAGPRYPDVPSEVNERNAWLYEHPAYGNAGATWSGIGHLPMNSNSGETDVLITLAYIPVAWEGQTIVVSAFDNDFTLAEALTATLDTINPNDWQAPIELSGNGTWQDNDIELPSLETGDTFYGGYLQVRYRAAASHDTFGWKITTEAAPWLVE